MSTRAAEHRPLKVPPQVLELLRCPRCRRSVAQSSRGLECLTGHRLDCSCGFIEATGAGGDDVTEATFRSFGFEWNSFSEVTEDDDAFARWYFSDVDRAELAGVVGLDAGCGRGRFSRVLAPHLDALVALDGSSAVAAAVRNLEGHANTTVVKADLRDPPFAVGSFGFVSCLGVLHHLADPLAGFDALARLLAPGGLLLVYLYSRPRPGSFRAAALAVTTMIRRRTVGMAHPRLRLLSLPLAVLLYGGVVLPGRMGEVLGIERLTELPLAVYRRRRVRSLWLDTFDRLSAPVERRFDWDEVAPWFERAGLSVEARRDEHGLLVLARRPSGEATQGGTS